MRSKEPCVDDPLDKGFPQVLNTWNCLCQDHETMTLPSLFLSPGFS